MKISSLTVGFVLVVLLGCAEGPLWKTGSYAPWVQEKWGAEDQVADTLFKRKRELNELVQSAVIGSRQQKLDAAKKLRAVIQRDQILLLRLHAVQLLGKIDDVEATDALKLASQDPVSKIRIAAVESWMTKPADVAVAQLQEIIGSDTNVDVRLAATRAIGVFSNQQSLTALSLALVDSNPAIQLRATESLGKITGEKIGSDVSAWQTYLSNQSLDRTASTVDTRHLR